MAEVNPCRAMDVAVFLDIDAPIGGGSPHARGGPRGGLRPQPALS